MRVDSKDLGVGGGVGEVVVMRLRLKSSPMEIEVVLFLHWCREREIGGESLFGIGIVICFLAENPKIIRAIR